MKKPSLAALFTACLLFASPLALAADDGGKDAAKEAKGDDYAQLPPFPADRTVRIRSGRSPTGCCPGWRRPRWSWACTATWWRPGR